MLCKRSQNRWLSHARFSPPQVVDRHNAVVGIITRKDLHIESMEMTIKRLAGELS